jgi:beta-glucosidase
LFHIALSPSSPISSFSQGTPLWDFGFGLSYTTFTFTPLNSHATVNTEDMMAHHPRYYASAGTAPSPAAYTVNVTNTGGVASDCVVLGFVSSDHDDAPVNRELFGYDRIFLQPGQSQFVYFSVPPQVLSLVDVQGVETIRPGTYRLQFGVHGAAEGTPGFATLEVMGVPRVIFSLPDVRRQAEVAG